MSFKVQVGPPQISIHHGQTVLVSEPDGQIAWPSDKGLYFLDTRVISSWRLFANGVPWELLNGGAVTYFGARIFQTNRNFVTEDAPIAARTLGLTLSRHIEGGMHEDIDISNNSGKAVRFNLEIAVRGADLFEVKSNRIVRRGHITSSWVEVHQRLRLTYRNRDFIREVLITAKPTGAKGGYANGRISFEISLNPADTWHCCLLYDLFDGTTKHASPRDCFGESQRSKHAESLEAWQRTVLKIRTSNEEFYRNFTQGVADMAALRLPIGGTDHWCSSPPPDCRGSSPCSVAIA
jgi:N-terminal domain of (some) glycogen debranching enzymes